MKSKYSRQKNGLRKNQWKRRGETSMTTKTTRLLIAGLGLALLAALIPVLAPGLMTGALAIPTMMTIVVVTIILLMSIISGAREKDAPEKRKRGLEGQDFHSVIDRLVDELDEDELAYLRKRLEEREQGRRPELTHSLEALLDERSETQQAVQR
jgi:hypothetical protein